MIAAILTLFGSTGFGALIGAFGGLANRFLDLKSKELDLQDKKDARAHEALLRDKDAAILAQEIKGALDIKSIEAVTASETAGYEAMKSSYENDKATYGITSVDWIRGVMRPLITACFVGLVLYINFKVWSVLNAKGVELSPDQAFEIIRWTLFEASVVIGWWFAMRPTGNAGLTLPKR